MKLEFAKSFDKKARKLTSKNNKLKQDFKKQLNLFKSDPNHPSLRKHRLHGKRSQHIAIWIKEDLRALATKSKSKKDTYIFFDIVTHDEY